MTQIKRQHLESDACELDHLRNLLDTLDDELVDLLSERGRLVDRVMLVKQAEELPIYAPEREQAIVEKVRARAARSRVSADIIEDIFRSILAESHRRMYRRRDAKS